MTYHIAYDYQCQACGADFIPYEEQLPCPKCGIAAQTWLGYARSAAESLNVNLQSRGSYMPGAFWVGTLGDRVLYLLFQTFERWRLTEPNPDFSEHLREDLPKIDFEPQHEYLREHIRIIALRTFEALGELTKPELRPGFKEIDAERGQMEATANADGWVKCPFCGKRFNIRGVYSTWNGTRHLSCGTSIILTESPAP